MRLQTHCWSLLKFKREARRARKGGRQKIAVRNDDKLDPLRLPNGDSFEPLDSVELARAGFARTPPCIATDTRTPTSGSLFSTVLQKCKTREAGRAALRALMPGKTRSARSKSSDSEENTNRI